MTITAKTTTVDTTATDKPKYLVQREKRQRYSFGNTWLNAVLAGVVTDKDKLIAHGVKVKAGTRSALTALSFETLLSRVQDGIYAEAPEATADTTEGDVETTETPAAA